MNEVEVSMSQALAPEDIRPGQYVAVLTAIEERIPMMFGDETNWKRAESIKFAMLPCACGCCVSSGPLKVLGVCLPFVLVKKPTSHGPEICTLDVRRYRLARLSDHFGETAYKLIRGKKRADADQVK